MIHDVIFRVTFKNTDIVKKFHISVPAEDDLQAYYKATAFAEKMVILEIQSVTPRTPVIAIINKEIKKL